MIKGNLYLPGRARVPIPKKSVEEGDKLGGKVLLSVNFETGEKIWDKEMEDKMGFRVEVSKDDFLKAIKNNKSQAGAIRELNIGVSTFYKYKKMWAAAIAEMEKARETKFAEILDSVDEGKPMPAEPAKFTKVCEGVYIEPAHATKPEPEEIHEPTMAETESFFGESTFNPEEPKKEEGNRVNALKAFDLMEKAREESYCVTTIFDQIIPITPAIRDLLANYRTETEMIVDEIEQKLGELTIRL